MEQRCWRSARHVLPVVLAAALASGGCASYWAYRSGHSAAQQGDWEKALARLTKAVNKSPENVRYRLELENVRAQAAHHYASRGRELLAAGDLDRAAEQMEIASNFDPTNQAIADELRELRARLRAREEEKRARAAEDRRARGHVRFPLPELSPRSQKPIALKFRDASLEKVLEYLGKITGVNVLLEPDFKDKQVSYDMQNVTFEEALDQITLANRLFYQVINPNTLLVVQDTPQKRKIYEDVLVQTFFLSNVNDEKEFAKMAQAAGKLAGIRKTHVDATLGAITLVGSPDRLALAEKVLQAYDKPRGEVMVEVQIIEVNRTRAKDYGITLSNYAVSSTFSPTGASGETSDGTTSLRAHLLASLNMSDFVVNIPSSLLARFTQEGGVARLLASPRLRAAEGEAAKLQIASKVPVPQTTFYSYGAQTGAGAGAFPYSPTTSFQYQDVGVTLEITPRISSVDEVSLKVKAEFSSLGASTNVGTDSNPLRIPEILTRKIEGTIRVKDGEAALLGGLIQNRDESSAGGLLGLQSVPILNRIFSATSKTNNETEILLSLTPWIVRAPRITQEDLRPLFVGTENAPRVKEARGALLGEPGEGEAQGPAEVGAPAPPGPQPVAPAPVEEAPSTARIEPSTPAPDALFSPEQLAVIAGRAQTVSLVVRRAQAVSRFEIDLEFDPALVQVENVVPGALLTLRGQTPSVLATPVEPGRLSARLAMPAGAHAAGSGVVASFTVRGLAVGATSVRVAALRLVGENGTEALVGASAPTLMVTVGPGPTVPQGVR